jgi:hypothetical protein
VGFRKLSVGAAGDLGGVFQGFEFQEMGFYELRSGGVKGLKSEGGF